MAGESHFIDSDEENFSENNDPVDNSSRTRSSAAASRHAKTRKRSGTFFRKKKRVRTALLTVEPSHGRDTGYCCDLCCCVFWDSTVSSRPTAWRHCPLCGEQLVRGSQVCYSKTAVSSEQDVMLKLRSVAAARPRPCVVEVDVDEWKSAEDDVVEHPTSGREKSEASPQSGSTKKAKRAREQVADSSDHGDEGSLTVVPRPRPLPPRRQDKFRFCDVCGHGSTEVNCSTCTSSFHKRCLNRPPSYPFPKRWTCHACVHRDLQRHGRIPEAKDFEERGMWKPPDAPTQCSSCGYLEIESVNCDLCERWFCFACMCLSVATVPRTSWFCPECVGQERYDSVNQESIAKSRDKLRIGDGTAKEQDGFSQLVFDLSCGCNWEEWERNINTLLEITRKQLAANIIPVMMPFHSLHYARPNIKIENDMIRRISIAYSKDTKEKAMRSVQSRDGQYHAWKEECVNKVSTPARLRIGYISSDFVNHPTADLIQSALLLHDERRFEVFCYSIAKDDKSEYRRTLSKEMEHFRNLPKKHSDKHCADTIAEDGIHILVNLNGHTAGDRNGISALRPAPLQLVYLAYPGTMGADYIDYNVADRTVCPPEHRQYYVERLLHLPFCYQTNSFMQLYPEILDKAQLPKRKDHQLPDRPTFVFCNFCRLGRITPELFDVWVRILRRVPNSVIWLYKHPKSAVLRLKSRAFQAGLAEDRFIFSPPCSPKCEHLKRVTLADVCLDTLVYNGHTTASDMLWAGVPYITMSGQNWPSLVATALAHTIEMPEMVVKNLSQYEELAVKLATKPSLLRKWKRKLADKRVHAPLFDSERWVRSFEDGLETVWRMYAEGSQEPRDVLCKDFGPSPDFLKRTAQCGAVPGVGDREVAGSVCGRRGALETTSGRKSRADGRQRGQAQTEAAAADQNGKSGRSGMSDPGLGSGGQQGGSLEADSDSAGDTDGGLQGEHDGMEETQYELELDPEDGEERGLEQEGSDVDGREQSSEEAVEDSAPHVEAQVERAACDLSRYANEPADGQEGAARLDVSSEVAPAADLSNSDAEHAGIDLASEDAASPKKLNTDLECAADGSLAVDPAETTEQSEAHARTDVSASAGAHGHAAEPLEARTRPLSPGDKVEPVPGPWRDNGHRGTERETPASRVICSKGSVAEAACGAAMRNSQQTAEPQADERNATRASIAQGATHAWGLWPAEGHRDPPQAAAPQAVEVSATPAPFALCDVPETAPRVQSGVYCLQGGFLGVGPGSDIEQVMSNFRRDVAGASLLCEMIADTPLAADAVQHSAPPTSSQAGDSRAVEQVASMRAWTSTVRQQLLAQAQHSDLQPLRSAAVREPATGNPHLSSATVADASSACPVAQRPVVGLQSAVSASAVQHFATANADFALVDIPTGGVWPQRTGPDLGPGAAASFHSSHPIGAAVVRARAHMTFARQSGSVDAVAVEQGAQRQTARLPEVQGELESQHLQPGPGGGW